jgi:hypothetical protein
MTGPRGILSEPRSSRAGSSSTASSSKKVEGKRASVDLRERLGVHKLKLEEGRAGIGTKHMDLVARALVEPSLNEQRGHIIQGGAGEGGMGSRKAHLDPAPDGWEECGCDDDDGDGVKGLGIVRGCEFGSLLERQGRRQGDASRKCKWKKGILSVISAFDI